MTCGGGVGGLGALGVELKELVTPFIMTSLDVVKNLLVRLNSLLQIRYSTTKV